MTITREAAKRRDVADPLAHMRDRFDLPDNVIYLDGNSLGALPKSVPARLADVMTREWGTDLIRSWNSNGWWEAPLRVGDKLAPLIGAAPGQVAIGDSTSINLYKQISVACMMRPDRPVVLSDTENFPTDLYMIAQVVESFGGRMELASGVEMMAAIERLGPELAAVSLTHVNYRSGAMYDMAAVTAAAHDVGALVVWDLAHSAGAVPVALDECMADFAVGCGYKYLNGGPGAPAFLYVAHRHIDGYRQPLPGWHGHARPFEFVHTYEPVAGIGRALTGTPPLLSLLALDTALDAFDGTTTGALYAKSIELSDMFIELVESRLVGHGFTLASPRNPGHRGSQVSFAHEHGYPIKQALIEAGVIGDYRAPLLLRFGFTPLYTSFLDVWDAVQMLVDIMESGRWQEPRFAEKGAVT